LLRVFVPCKLSANGGVEKVSILKNVRFSGRRGEVIAFLDHGHAAKTMLLRIVSNDQQSDAHLEKGVSGEVRFTERVRLSCCLSPALSFAELTVRQHL
jgi:ABC-type polysaccharide/polyol phosphate transport system ATPase subunit